MQKNLKFGTILDSPILANLFNLVKKNWGLVPEIFMKSIVSFLFSCHPQPRPFSCPAGGS